ncbi:flagellar basal-body rod protein FlgC [bacterium BMS3Bbin06]|nr:flagellar basal-body rod protein FlgC [bacterium BMS3Abin08]GBE33836.1 flagellar basal-body rod protein FlgC [bacterium BMS3Bbin06]HDO36642.1 flagellar basal body rod protein FlgC [Nitrospirota bacterium]HDY71682.1 flagellar basal body rod protein FlgC [Nitrospirota bacterium]
MDIFRSFDVSATALAAQKIRMNTIASNLANINTTNTPGGGPYRRRDVLFSSVMISEKEGLEGVELAGVVEDNSPPRAVYDPGHPDADKKGFVLMPNINLIEEMVNMMLATRAYEANVNAFNITKNMYQKALEIGR